MLGALYPLGPELFIDAGTGNVGIGTIAPGERLSVAGTIESTSGGFRFPDGTVQQSAQLVGPAGPALQAARRAGPGCRLVTLEGDHFAAFREPGRGIAARETAAFFANWYADYPDAENFLVPLFHSRNVGGGGNRARLAIPAIDDDLAALDRMSEVGPRAAAAAVLDRRIHELAPWIYLWHPVLEVASAERVRGYRPHPIAAAERWLDIELVASGIR